MTVTIEVLTRIAKALDKASVSFKEWVRGNICSCDAYYGVIDAHCPVHYGDSNA